jgi:septal ring factor EnvC (AmiA/AmiB activator)
LKDKKENSEQGLWNSIWSYIRGALFEEDPRDIISSNAKSVLIGLFILIGLAIIFYSLTVSAGYFTLTSDQSKHNISKALSHYPINLASVNNLLQQQLNISQQLQNKIANPNKSNTTIESQLNDTLKIIKLIEKQTNSLTQTQSQSLGNASQIGKEFTDLQRRDQQLEQINSVFIAAIAGALALGGTLITQLWGRKD